MQLQGQDKLFERVMNATKRLRNSVTAPQIDATSAPRAIEFPLSFVEADPLFSDFESRFAGYVRYPFTQCEFSLLCKQKRKMQKPISTVRFDFEKQKWKMAVYNDNEYAVESAM